MTDSSRPSFFQELKRRRVVRAVLVYGLVAWFVVQVADVFFPALRLPGWSVTLVAALALLGFPLTVALAWIFDRTPEGLKRTAAGQGSVAQGAGPFRTDVRFVSAVGLGVLIGLVVVGTGTFLRSDGSPPVDHLRTVPASVAVLPFTDMSAEQDQAWFGQGIAEEILNALTHVEGLTVAARTSSFRYAAPGFDIPAIGDSLRVATVLEGSVRRAGGRVRITAQLVETAGGRHLWSERYDRELTTDNVLDVQEEIARAISRRLTGSLRGEAVAGSEGEDDVRLTRRHTADLEAYQLFLKGRFLWNRRTPESVGEAIQRFREAVDLDPAYAQAWAALAEAYATPTAPYEAAEALPRAKAAALRALALDSTLAPAHTALAYALMNHDHDWEGSEAAFRRAIAADPAYPTAHQWYAEFLATVGETGRAVESVRNAERLDPLSMIIGWNVARTLYFDRQFRPALEQLLEVRRLHGSARGWFTLYYMLWAGYHAGEIDADDPIARQVVPAVVEELRVDGAPAEVIVRVEELWARGGLLDERNEDLLGPIRSAAWAPPGIYVWLDNVDDLFERVETLTARGGLSWRLTEIAADPALDPVRADPRYQAWLESVGLREFRESRRPQLR
jgi:TolB-like protein